MRVLVYWEQDSTGGVDTHLLELLAAWPNTQDEFVILHNEGNRGVERIRGELKKLPRVSLCAVRSFSFNERLRRIEGRLARRFAYLLQPLWHLLSVAPLRRAMQRLGDFDVLLSNNGGYPAAWGCLSALAAAHDAGIATRILLVHHAATRPNPFMAWFEQLVDREVMRLASAITCVSWATRQTLLDYRHFDAEKVRFRVIHNQIYPRRQGAATCADLRRIAGVAPGEKLVGVVGRIEPYKGQEDMLFAIARLGEAQRRRLRLVLIGSSERVERERLCGIARQLGIADRVCFPGYIEGDPVDIIRQMDLLVVATRSFEGYGLTLAEAMLAGIPILSTRVGAVPEFVDESLGCLVPPSAPHDLALALDDFLERGGEWQQRARLAQQRVQNPGRDMATEYRRLFVECMATNGSGA